MDLIPYGKQSIDEDDVAAVTHAIRQSMLTQGDTVPKFERAVADYCSAKYAVASNSATSSLHVACLALGVETGDIVWVPAISFVASANCARYCGAQVEFVDIEQSTYNISIEKLTEKLSVAERNNVLPKLLVVVHMAGCSPDMKKIKSVCDKYSIKILEDASHSVGADYAGKKIGSCSFSDVAVFSFHPVKMITTIEGGMALTNDLDIARKLRLHGSHGVSRDKNAFSNGELGPLFYEQIELGYNYRMNDVQAALGLTQLSKLDRFVARRRKLAHRYFEGLNLARISLPEYENRDSCSYHLFIARMKNKKNRDGLLEDLKSSGILCNIHYIPIYRHQFHSEDQNRFINECQNAEEYYSRAISLPIFVELSDVQQDKIIKTVNAYVC